MVKEQIVQHAMQIILHAGDARKHCMDALKRLNHMILHWLKWK